jgi:FtsP/CotA-like multicopper oxidase with cupredoxin domain
MRPGAVERWRLIHSGQRERILLELERSDTVDQPNPETLALHEIAIDGLPMDKVVTLGHDSVELYPGYRADVLVQAPAVPGEYPPG